MKKIMKKLTTFLSLVAAATILSGCYVSPYAYNYSRSYGYQCPPPIKVDVAKKKKVKTPTCEPVCEPCKQQVYKPVCKPVYRPTCIY
ncbi:MAG: hypothetical protein D3904_12120 [Candidatus Electrothrix sp. EH2]|nr:hypothetical protein [Candidatus Electrothrix sp. EH2]